MQLTWAGLVNQHGSIKGKLPSVLIAQPNRGALSVQVI